MSLNDFEIIKRLGEGAYSSVYHVRRIADGDYYALKKVRMQKLSDKEKENALNEVRILASIRHNNIIAYKEAFIDEASQSLCIIMEYADSGDLFQQICEHQKNNTLFKEDDIWKMFIQMVRGLKCLHEILIFHRDLKSANVFLNKDGSAKLGDMNVSKVAKKGMLYTQTGTPYYASPEVWRDQPYDNKSDIWSLGCVLYESITLKPPFRADDMQGLYKKVLRGVYPKIPTVYSADLANLVKALIQVTPQMRPSCERILEMPIIRKRMEKLFPQDEFYDSQSSLLNTIRVPKNLLYLTDRLPKPSYESPTLQRKKLEEEERRRKTHDAGGMLPEIKNQKMEVKKPAKNAPNADQSQNSPPAIAQQQQQPGQQVPSQGRKNRKPNNKSVRVRSDLRQVDAVQVSENYNPDDVTVKIGATGQHAAAVEEDRGSVASKGSALNQPHPPPVPPSQREPNALRKNNTKKERQAAVSQRAVKETEKEQANDDYDNDQFERDDIPSYSPPPKAQHVHTEESVHESPPYYQNSNNSPSTKRTNITKILPQQQHQNQPGQVNPSHPIPPSNAQMILQNRPQINYSLNNAPNQSVQSVERIYVPKNSSLPSLAGSGADNQSTQNTQSRKNLAYINITGDGAKPVGYLGLKKAEKDLIMRRYKYNHHVSDHIQRVALIYGNPYAHNKAGGGDGNHPSYQLNYGLPTTGQSHSVSPYLQSQVSQIQGLNNVAGMIKRNKYGGGSIIEEQTSNIGGRGNQEHMRLPKLPSVNRQNVLDHNGANQQSQAMLPPLGSGGSLGSINGHGLLTKGQAQQQQLLQQQLLQQQQIGVGANGGYQPYIIKPTKIKSLTKPSLGPAQGVSVERINLGKYGGVPTSDQLTKISTLENPAILQHPLAGGGGSVSRSHILQSVNNSQASQNQQQPTTGDGKELRQIYQRKSKASSKQPPTGSRGNRGPQGGLNSTDVGGADGGDQNNTYEQ